MFFSIWLMFSIFSLCKGKRCCPAFAFAFLNANLNIGDNISNFFCEDLEESHLVDVASSPVLKVPIVKSISKPSPDGTSSRWHSLKPSCSVNKHNINRSTNIHFLLYQDQDSTRQDRDRKSRYCSFVKTFNHKICGRNAGFQDVQICGGKQHKCLINT